MRPYEAAGGLADIAGPLSNPPKDPPLSEPEKPPEAPTLPSASSPPLRSRARFSWSRACFRIALGGGVLSLAYTFILAMAGEPSWRSWIGATQLLTDMVAYLVPGVRHITRELTNRGFPAQAGYVEHVVAMQWLISAVSIVFASAALVPERARLRRGLAAFRAKYRPARTDATWFVRFHWVLILFLIVWPPFLGDSQDRGRHGYDLAKSWEGFFYPFCLTTTLWGWATLYVWFRLLLAVTARNETQDAGSPRREPSL
jgi:hypothetical protein